MIRILCAEQMKGGFTVRAFLQDLGRRDCAGDAAVHMRETDEGWQPVRTAAA